MIWEVKGDLLNLTVPHFFCHQVNHKGVMGSGIAFQIKNKYPMVFEDYRRNIFKKPLGENIISRISDYKFCVNMIAQEGYGTDKQYTDYEAFESCLYALKVYLNILFPTKYFPWVVAFPYNIGCGRGGGDWNLIRSYIEKFSNEINLDVFIVRL